MGTRRASEIEKKEIVMFMASNQFKVVKGQEEAFEKTWSARSARLNQTPGFISFRFQKGRESGNHILYFSLTMWETEESFLAWKRSEQFRESRENSGSAGRRLVAGLCRFDELDALPRRNPQ